ncbi:MAG: NAD(P)H-hydrate dehydratase [Lentisphaeria bacterium]|nr:NAD(P)H-hydrate dehydratase [Lentisphaeria bacterium]
MEQVISSAEMRNWEQANFDSSFADPLELMYIAGKGCAELFLQYVQRYSDFQRIVIFAGHGNNGGDGVVMASYLAERVGAEIVLALAKEPEKFSVSSKYYFQKLHKKVQVIPAEKVQLFSGDLIVDALLGTGCSNVMHEPYKSLINSINQSRCLVFAVDLPSGLGADTTVRADITAVIGGFKDILFTESGIESAGLLKLVELPLSLEPESRAGVFAASEQWFRKNTKPMSRSVHKYQRGSVLVIGGSQEYFQAPFLTARSVLRAGAGLVRLLIPFAVQPGSGALSIIPVSVKTENGAFSGKNLADVLKYSEKADCIAVGPGMGRNLCSKDFIAGLLKLDKPLLLDADALYFASQMPELFQQRQAPTVLTPHRGEAQRLAEALNMTIPDDNIAFARLLAKHYNSTVLLKGARTVTAAPDGRVRLNTSGSPALATAGSGDVLTGLIAGEMAHFHSDLTDLEAWDSAARGAFLHGLAGEYAGRRFGNGVTADDLPEAAAEVFSAKY